MTIEEIKEVFETGLGAIIDKIGPEITSISMTLCVPIPSEDGKKKARMLAYTWTNEKESATK